MTSASSDPDLAGFRRFAFSTREFTHLVYETGEFDAAPVLVLQELPGFAPGLVQFARRLAAAGHRVYLPWLFGPFGRRTPLRNYAQLCISQEFGRLRAGVTAPVTLWLRELVSRISAENGDRCVAAIGMCVTGGFAIPLLLHPKVQTAVAAQPAIPVSLRYLAFGSGGAAKRAAFNVADAEMSGARQRLAAGSRLLAVRCRADRLCPAEKLQALQDAFPTGLTVREYGAPDTVNAAGERPHATYTKEYRIGPEDPQHYSRVAFDELLAFLRAQD